MPIKFTLTTIKALATLVQVLDKHPFGAVMLILSSSPPTSSWQCRTCRF